MIVSFSTSTLTISTSGISTRTPVFPTYDPFNSVTRFPGYNCLDKEGTSRTTLLGGSTKGLFPTTVFTVKNPFPSIELMIPTFPSQRTRSPTIKGTFWPFFTSSTFFVSRSNTLIPSSVTSNTTPTLLLNEIRSPAAKGTTLTPSSSTSMTFSSP